LSEGFYEGEFKSYCLQPGTPGPSGQEAYLQAPLNSYRKEIVQTILRNSLTQPQLEQRNIQLLLWSVVSHSDFRKLSWEVQQTAGQLLTRKQIFELKGGVMGVVNDVSSAFPETQITTANSKLKELFEMGSNSYEMYEHIAVLQQKVDYTRPGAKQDQWYKQPGGYYLRYFPSSYQKLKVQVYVPKTSVENNPGNYLLFDPVSMMAVPAHSNSQRLGVGAPITDILRKIIIIQKTPAPTKKEPVKIKNPKIPT
jgi:DNA-binding sugar fermentation-stimulating protein